MVDRISPKDILPVLRNEERAAEAWAQQASALLGKGLVGAALLAEARAVGAGASPERLGSWLAEKVPTATVASAISATNEATAALEKLMRFGHEPEKMVARLVDGIMLGGSPPALLRAVAETLEESAGSRAALDVIRGAIALAPEMQGEQAAALASILITLGRFEEARAAIADVAKHDAKQAESLRTYLGALTHPFDFRAAGYLAGDPDDDAELSPLSLAEAQSGIRSIARRASLIRASLVELEGEAPWLPAVAPLLAGPHDALPDDYDATSLPSSVPELILELRKEWSRLSWAIAALGGVSVALPTAIARPRCAMGFVDSFTAARFDLLCDVAEGKAPAVEDELDKQLLASTFGGTPLAELDPKLAQIWLDETEAALSGLRWAMGKVETPWAPE